MSNYVLAPDGQTPIKCDDMEKFMEWYGKSQEQRVVKKSQFGPYQVSTVFLAMDHSLGYGEPVLWETMIFGGHYDRPENEYQVRASSYAEAIRMHDQALDMLREEDRKAVEKLIAEDVRRKHEEETKEKEATEQLTTKKSRKIIL